MVFVAFPLLLLIFFSLSLIFVSLIAMCLGIFLLGFILSGTLCTSWTWVSISFPLLGNFFSYCLFRYFLRSLFSLSSPSGAPIMQMLVCLMLSQRSLRLSPFLFIFFSLFCSMAVISTSLSLGHLCIVLVILLLIPFGLFFISVILLVTSVCSLVLLGLC